MKMANRLEAFQVEKINRKQIKNAPYNPRRINKEAEKKIRKSLRDFGMLAPITWNKVTGNIVGGHQRLNQMDTILKKDDYEVTVAVVELEEIEEVKANIVLNNPSVMGEWDEEKLSEIKIDFPEIDFEKELGFDKHDIDLIFADIENEEVFTPFSEQKEIKNEVQRMAEIDKIKRIKKEKREEYKKENKEGITHQVEDDDYLLTFVFPNNSEKYAAMKKLKQNPKERYLKHTILYDIQDGKRMIYGRMDDE